MIVIEPTAGQLSVNVFGEFTLADFKEFEQAVNEKSQFAQSLNLRIDLRQMTDFTIDMVLEDIEFTREHPHAFHKIAVISDSQWVSWGAWLTQIFVDARVHVFTEEADAHAWLNTLFAFFDTHISCSQLAELMSIPNADYVIFDCRHRLDDADYGQRAYESAHLPDAFFMHLERDLSHLGDPKNGRHPLPEIREFVQKIRACGVSSDTQVIVYDDMNGVIAARLWWMLKFVGHEHAAVLNGGWQRWLKKELPTSSKKPVNTNAMFNPKIRTQYVFSLAEVIENLEMPRFLLVDSRSADRFAGTNETIDAAAGHIPGAKNRFFGKNLKEDGTFLSKEELHNDFVALLDGKSPSETVFYCGSGVSACHNLLAMHIAGLEGAKLYVGSWSEWCADPARPIAGAT